MSLTLVSLVALLAAGEVGPSAPPVVAYLFTMRRPRHPLQSVWSTYFSGCRKGSYKIYIHTDPSFNISKPARHNRTNHFFNLDHVIPNPVRVKRFGYEMVDARMRLARHAMMAAQGQQPEWLLYFSESCAPISHCLENHKYLRHHRGRTFIKTRPVPQEQKLNTIEWQQSFKKTCPQCSDAGIPPTEFRHSPGCALSLGTRPWSIPWYPETSVCPVPVLVPSGPEASASQLALIQRPRGMPCPHAGHSCAPPRHIFQTYMQLQPTPTAPSRPRGSWVGLYREHANRLLESEDTWRPVFTNFNFDKLVNGIPDESYWSTLAQHYSLPIWDHLLTYMEPGDPKTGHSAMFFEKDVSRLWTLGPPSLFARKFNTSPATDKALHMRLLQQGQRMREDGLRRRKVVAVKSVSNPSASKRAAGQGTAKPKGKGENEAHAQGKGKGKAKGNGKGNGKSKGKNSSAES